MSLFFCRVTPTPFLSPLVARSNLALRLPPGTRGRNMSTMGRVAVPELAHMTEERSFVGDAALGAAL